MTVGHELTKVPVLTSWKEIARYMGKGVRTVQRWEQDFGLPVRRPTGSDKKAVLARPCDLDAWVAMRFSSRSIPAIGSDPRTTTLIHRTALVSEMETFRLLREANRTLKGEVRCALDTLNERLAALCSKAA